MKGGLLFGEVVGQLGGVVVASEAVDELVSGSEDPGFDLLRDCLVIVGGEARDFLVAGLYELMEAVSAGGEAFLEEFQLALEALLLRQRHQYY